MPLVRGERSGESQRESGWRRLNAHVLLERDEPLAALRALLDDVLAGHGRLVFVGGQAGVGKTTLVTEFTAESAERAAVRRGSADNITTPAGLGAVVEAVPELAEGIDGPAALHRLSMFRRLRTVLSATPTIVVLEDVHWADRATLDLLVFIGRRLPDLPALIIATLRSDEVDQRHPLSVAMGDLATARGVSRLTLEPLTAFGVAALAAAAGSMLDPDDLFVSTGGNPFYVTEVLASSGSALPESVRDAVTARTARLSTEAQQVLTAAAVLGQRADVSLLVEVSGQEAWAVDECVRRGVLVGDGDGWTFRHEIARVAVEEAVLPAERQALHARALAVLRGHGGSDDRRLAYHAAESGDREATVRHAPRAAVRAARLGAHREAAEQYRLALRAIDPDAPERVDLLEALSYECHLTDQAAEALTARQQLLELLELRGDAAAIGATKRWLSRLSWYLGRGEDSERYAAEAVATLELLGESAALAMAYSNLSQLRMLDADVEEAVVLGRRAIEMAHRVGDVDVEIHALNNVGTALCIADDAVEGRRDLARSLDLALAADAQEHVARAYTNLGSTAVVNRRFVDADRQLRAGIAYCTERDLDSWSLYMVAFLARSLAEQGRLEEAAESAARILRQPHLSPISQIAAAVVGVQVAARRGADAPDLLAQATALAEGTGEAQRLLPVATARIELAWAQGRDDDLADAVHRGWAAAGGHPGIWDLGELAWWSSLAGVAYPPTTPVSEPFALMLAGSWTAAAEAWDALGAFWWAAIARVQSPELDEARVGAVALEAMGATAVRDRVFRDRRAQGLPIPRGPRGGTRGEGLVSAREMDVLRLLVDGLTDAQIADELFLSPKTVGHHVSSLLRKLDEPTRARAVATAVRRGLVSPT
jgi:DNA-binding CsgD family transcriptional regulator/tetratricopeptide (TPR) repeat protein